MNTPPYKYQSIYICLILALTTIAVYWPVCTYDFVTFDDPEYVYENPNIQSGITLKDIKWAFTTGYAANWHPFTWLSHMLDWQFFGSNAGGHHLTNLIFHIANTLLLFIVLKQMTHRIWPSAFVAALFALHPLHVESVAWVAERKDVLSTFFWMLTMWAYLRYVEHRRVVYYLLMLLIFALGLMTKPMLVTLPFVLILLDYWPLARVTFERQVIYRLIREKIPLFVLSSVSCVVTILIQQGAAAKLEALPIKFRIFNAFISYIEYIRKMIWPVHLAVFYPHHIQDVSISQAVKSAVFLSVITVVIFRFANKYRYLFTGWFWYLGTLVPVIGIIQVGQQALADRYTYIPLTGLFIIITWGLPDLLTKWQYKKILFILSALLILSALSVSTHFQLCYWRDSQTLCQHSLSVTGCTHVMRLCLAEYLLRQNKLNKAIRCLEISPNNSEDLNDLGASLSKKGNLDLAIECFNRALKIRPDFAEAHDNIGYAMVLQGRADEAVVHFAEALRLNPSIARPHYYYGRAMAQNGKINEAVMHYEDALRLEPNWIEPMNDIARLLASSKETTILNSDRAVKLAQRACELTNYQRPDFLDTLAVAYAAAGDFDKAVEVAERAMELCKSPEQNTLRVEIESCLVLYKAGKTYIEK